MDIVQWWLNLPLYWKIVTLLILPLMPLVLLFAALFPLLLAPTVTSSNAALPRYHVVQCHFRLDQVRGTLTLRTPNVVRAAEATIAKATIRLDEGILAPGSLKATASGLGVQILEVRDDHSEREFGWTWFVSFPAVALGTEPVFDIAFNPAIQIEDQSRLVGSNVTVTGPTIRARVVPLDGLGLTQLQYAIFAVIGGLSGLAVGIVGAIRIRSKYRAKQRAKFRADHSAVELVRKSIQDGAMTPEFARTVVKMFEDMAQEDNITEDDLQTIRHMLSPYLYGG